MKIAIIGNGKMGKTIQKLIAGSEAHSLNVIINNYAELKEKSAELSDCDVAIEFTQPNSVVNNIKYCVELGLPIVTGTTGWYNQFEKVINEVKSNNGALFYATNFSVGVNLFFEINRRTAQLMNKQPYDVLIEEIHHTEKKDAPSGTAITLAENIVAHLDLKNGWTLHPETANNKVPITAIRTPKVPGTHTTSYTSIEDEIILTHTAKGRTGFAKGAVKAAEFIQHKQGVFTMKDLLHF